MKLLCDVLQFLSAASLAIFVGAMLTEGLVLVPYWRALAPGDFLAWYAANDRRLLGFFGPLTAVTALLAIVAALAALWAGRPGRWLALLAAVLALVVVSTFFLYFAKANASFAAATIGVGNVPAELARWSAWHWARTVLSIAALAAALVSLWQLRPPATSA